MLALSGIKTKPSTEEERKNATKIHDDALSKLTEAIAKYNEASKEEYKMASYFEIVKANTGYFEKNPEEMTSKITEAQGILEKQNAPPAQEAEVEVEAEVEAQETAQETAPEAATTTTTEEEEEEESPPPLPLTPMPPPPPPPVTGGKRRTKRNKKRQTKRNKKRQTKRNKRRQTNRRRK